ncbi:hypothetical protein [Citrobacter freundii]|uniref:hypothetical protein n=1 Tax=Citrobacter freundii TaxID=546 RepID=UPI000FB9FB83|nr:hypothetical protein [Citrobacter freundii]EFB6600030.1 hypothetical protein [Escherichia coli]EFN5112217.1 hypothetical protein [Escherichia coli]MHT11992.1 hypothetical protein [Escherichia coli]BDT25877.1 hypothetical protein CF204P1_46000 [Citrobacter freundii]HAT4405191.1 hypothetical protein [Citrobacter freundii]
MKKILMIDEVLALARLSQVAFDKPIKYMDDTDAELIARFKKTITLKWFTEFGHLNRGDMLTSEQHRCHNEKKKFQRRV